MAVLTIEELKTLFSSGKYPRQIDYESLIDTLGGGSGNATITASDTAPVDPDPAQLWYNTAEAKAYIYYDSFWIELVPSTQGPAGEDGQDGRFITSATAPANPVNGDAWFDTESGKMFVYYDSYWVEIGPNLQGPAGPAGATGPQGPQGEPGIVVNYIHPYFF